MCAEREHDYTVAATTQSGHQHGHSATNAQEPSADTAECPVMPGSFVNKTDAEDEGLVRDYQGQKFYLCCDACGPMWDANPARYAQPA